jgi:hypothetical protein
MNALRIVVAVLGMMAGGISLSAAADQAVFGPVTYDVKERHGKVNRYTGTFTASEGLYLIKLQNGEKLQERSEYIELVVNGDKVLKEDKYAYRFIGGFVNLSKDSKIEIALRDDQPAGFRRPALPPRFVTLTVTPAPAAQSKIRGFFGLNSWEDLTKYAGAFLKIANAEAQSLAMTAASLQNDTAVRAEAMRKLSDLKDSSSQEYLLGVYTDMNCVQDVRGEAALALGVLGDKASVPVLMPGILAPEDKVRTGSARALSFYKEEDTQEQLLKTLERLDSMRKDAVIKSIVNAGWKPVGAILKLAESSDQHVAGTATKLLGGMQDPRATDLLLKFLTDPGPRDQNVIISALGSTKDPRAV